MSTPQIETREFDRLRRLIRQAAGIDLTDQKRHLVAGRLAARLRALGLTDFVQYVARLDADPNGPEVTELVNAITTNKTSFFREPHHFDFVAKTVLPGIVARAAAGAPRKVRIWSAGCSTGEEPWTIAITVAEALRSLVGWDVRILASDLDTKVLATAERAVYDERLLEDVPPALRGKYFERAGSGLVRVVAPLRELVAFRRLNLVEPASWTIRTRFDAVFCRNVAIYFDRPTQELVFKSLASVLEPTGYLMSGHSENLHWLASTLRSVGQTIHVPTDAVAALPPPPSRRGKSLRPPRPASIAPRSRRARSSVAPRSFVPRVAIDAGRGVLSSGVPSRREISLQVGGVHASAKGAVLRTILGSCVAACLWDPEARVGGMNHFLLPEDPSGLRGPTNFGVHAMELLVNSVIKLGGDRRRFVAKLFGGAELKLSGSIMVGRMNAEFACRYFEEEGIPVVAQKLGGLLPLSIIFETATGKVLVREIEPAADIVSAERGYRAQVSVSRPIEDDIVFFGAP